MKKHPPVLKLPSSFPVVLICLAAAAVLILLFSNQPLSTLYSFFPAAFTKALYLGEMLNTTVLLSLSGLGIIIAFRAGAFNLGGEGQAYAGAFCVILLQPCLPREGFPGGIALLLAAGAAGGGLLALVSGALKSFWNVDVLISSFLLSTGVSRVIDYMIAGPLSDPESYLITTAPLPEAYRLSSWLPPGPLNGSLVLPLIFIPLVWYVLNHTKGGHELRLAGQSPGFARYGGVNLRLYEILPLGVSGVLNGLAGALVITGSTFAGIQGLTSGLGWNGMASALIAGQKVWALLPAAFFFSWLRQGAKLAALRSGLSLELGAVIQGVLFLLITSRVLGLKISIPFRRRPE